MQRSMDVLIAIKAVNEFTASVQMRNMNSNKQDFKQVTLKVGGNHL